MTNKNTVYRLTESALMLAVASVLSVFKLVHLPFGGSITLFSMLPLLVIAYRHGTRYGLFTAFVYGVIQLLLGLDNLSYATSFGAAVAIVLFDYLLAFTVLGFGGIFRRVLPSQGAALALGAAFTGALRYLCHVVSGSTVWYGLSVPSGESLVYSLSYNIFMVPEIILLIFGATWLSRYLDLSHTALSRAEHTRRLSPLSVVLSAFGSLCLLAALVFDTVTLVPHLQTEDSAFDFSGLAAVPWTAVILFTAAGVLLFILCTFLAKRHTR